MQRMISRWCAPVLAMAMMAPIANADAITSYTAIDLGPATSRQINQPEYQLSNTGADGTLTTSTGVVYAFPRTDNSVVNPQALLATFPPLGNAPIHDVYTYGDPKFAYSYLDASSVFLNKQGVFAATDLVGVDGHASGSQSIVYTANRQANGTFSPLVALWTSNDNGGYNSGTNVAKALDLNNAGQFLGMDDRPGYRDYFVFDPHTGLRIEIASLLPTGWSSYFPIALDDQGRILTTAYSITNEVISTDVFLLTPAGLSSAPIPAPEPSTFAILTLAGVGLMIHRRRKS